MLPKRALAGIQSGRVITRKAQRCKELAHLISCLSIEPFALGLQPSRVLQLAPRRLLTKSPTVDAMPAQALQLFGHCLGIDHCRARGRPATSGRLTVHTSSAPLVLHSRNPSVRTAIHRRSSNLQVAAAYTSLSSNNGTARPPSSAGPAPAPQAQQPLTAVADPNKATIKVLHLLLATQNKSNLLLNSHCDCNLCDNCQSKH